MYEILRGFYPGSEILILIPDMLGGLLTRILGSIPGKCQMRLRYPIYQICDGFLSIILLTARFRSIGDKTGEQQNTQRAAYYLCDLHLEKSEPFITAWGALKLFIIILS